MHQQFKQGEELQADLLAANLLEDADHRLIILMGLPASGKSGLADRLEKAGAVRVNRDAIRKRLYGDENIFGDSKTINAEFYKELRQAFATGKTVVSDNVNITVWHRKGAIAAARECGYNDLVVVFIDVPLEVCLERNKARPRQTKEDVMRSMHADMRADGLPKEEEGDLLVLKNGKDREHYLIETAREGTPPAPQQTVPALADAEVAAQRQALGDSLHKQVKLFRACLVTGRDQWAAETLTTIRGLADGGAVLFGGVAAPTVIDKPAKKKWVPPTPEQIQVTLNKMIGHRPVVNYEGPLVALCFNGYLLNKEKAQLMLPPLLDLVRRAHMVFVQESNVDALRIIARAAKYGLNASHRNVREQACGMLYHPRLQWLGKPFYHDYLLDVPGHPEYKNSLRPGIQQRLRDQTTDFVFDTLDLHGKSNLGGPDATRPTRRWAFEALVGQLNQQAEKSPYEKRDLPPNASAMVDYSGWDLPLGPVIIGGDYNCPIENPESTEIEPLINAGFTRVSTPDKAWSYRFQERGGQFDGFFVRGFEGMVKECFIPPFFPKENKRDTIFYKEFSDHLPVFVTLDVPNRKPPAGQAAPSGEGEAKQQTEVVESQTAPVEEKAAPAA